jgi:LPXTG-motif cell wall-anchored protein
MLEHTGANVKEIIEQSHIGFYLGWGFAGLILVGLFFWIVRRKKKKEGLPIKQDRE